MKTLFLILLPILFYSCKQECKCRIEVGDYVQYNQRYSNTMFSNYEHDFGRVDEIDSLTGIVTWNDENNFTDIYWLEIVK